MGEARSSLEAAPVRFARAPEDALSWVEIDRDAIEHNYSVFRALAGERAGLMAVVKANAYGHGLAEVSSILEELGADWLATFSAEEAFALRDRGIRLPILVLGPTPRSQLAAAARTGVSVTVASLEAMEDLLDEAPPSLRVHLKVETGTNRQGLTEAEFPRAAALLERAAARRIAAVEGAYTHFADVEDTTDNTFALAQIERFERAIDRLAALGVRPEILHTACTAAALLYPRAHYALLRVGIGIYGLWPSPTTLLSVRDGRKLAFELKPAMTWKTRIAQVKSLFVGETVGYGRTYEVTRPMRVGVLPVGYANGYPRAFTGRAYVLVEGKRASVVGRVMMNMTAIDVSDIPEARVGTEVVLLGRSRAQRLTAERLAGWMDSIHYEVVTNVERLGRRVVVGGARRPAARPSLS